MKKEDLNIDLTTTPPTCLPKEIDTSTLIDITEMQHTWRVFLNRNTGEIYDGQKYFDSIDQTNEPK